MGQFLTDFGGFLKISIATILMGLMSVFGNPRLAYANDCQPRVPLSAEFLALGPIQEVGGLIWSSAAPSAMNHRLAITFCSQLGGEARLPALKDYLDWMGALEARRSSLNEPEDQNGEGSEIGAHYHAWFWASTLHDEHDFRAYYFDSTEVKMKETFRVFLRSVRCVVDCL